MERPNILLILTDQHRYDCVGWNNGICRTPSIDGLASAGVNFTKAYSVCPLCTPARAAIYSGLLPHRTGVVRNIHEDTTGQGPSIGGRFPSLAERLSGRGYQCVLEGKWHAGTKSAQDCGFAGTGFTGYGNPAGSEAYRDYLSKHGLPVPEVEWVGHGYDHRLGLAGIASGPEEAQIPAFLASTAIESLEGLRETDEPFFMAVNFWGPHAPYIPCEPYASMYAAEDLPPWPSFNDSLEGKPPIHRRWRDALTGEGNPPRDWEECARWMALCMGFVTQIDRQIGRILEALASGGEDRETIVLFSSDHGDLLGAHGGMHDKDGILCEELMRVPLIIRDPSLPAGGVDCDAPVSNLDLAATILDYAGCDTGNLDSRSLRQCVRDPSFAPRDHVFSQFFGSHFYYEARMVIRDNWKYVFHPGAVDELYDLEQDPAELVNRIEDGRAGEALRNCRQKLMEATFEVGDPLHQMVRFLFAERLLDGTVSYADNRGFKHDRAPRVQWK